jgi:hypothetical protein
MKRTYKFLIIIKKKTSYKFFSSNKKPLTLLNKNKQFVNDIMVDISRYLLILEGSLLFENM